MKQIYFEALILVALLMNTISTESQMMQKGEWTDVEAVFGQKGVEQDGVYKETFPRNDLLVKIGDFPVSAGLALTSWAGFIRMDNITMMMGDLVITDKEEPYVIKKIIEEKLMITAIHNHLIGEIPQIKYVHFSGKGSAKVLAEKLKQVFKMTNMKLEKLQMKQSESPDWSKVESILGKSGKHNGKLLQYGFPREEKLKEDGLEMPPYIGMATSINFQMDGNRAGITGDFVLLADEVNPVAMALVESGINVTAIHNHMLYDEPRLFMLHFWAVGEPEKLARGLRNALEKTNSKQ